MNIENIKNEGDKGQALCYTCQSKVNTTYQKRDMDYSDNSGTVYNLIVSVCDNCDDILTIPASSLIY